MSSSTSHNDEIINIQLGVEVAPASDDEEGQNCFIFKQSAETVFQTDTSAGGGIGIDDKDSVSSSRFSLNFGRFPSTSSSPGSTPLKSAPSTPKRINRSDSTSSVIGLLPLTPTTPDAINLNPPPSSPLTKTPPSPTIDEGPTIGVLEPEMFTGVETVVVPSEPDLISYNSVELTSIGEEKTKFQFSANHNNVTFHRRFPQVDSSERLINYYSCALQADILLQGFLYITENYFAFYSNILGLYKTKLLVPVCDVRDITKEKTAIIIPNAVGIETHQGKYVFASLLSRESTYRLMTDVWKNTISRGSFQMETFPFDQLRPTQEATTDNGNSSPSTPTKEESATKSIEKLSVDALTAGSLLLGSIERPITVSGQVSASSSLKRTKLLHRSKGQRQDCSDSSTPETTSDLDYGVATGADGDDKMLVGRSMVHSSSGLSKETGHCKSKLMVDGWRRLSFTIKSLGERLKSDLSTPFIHIAIIILLTYLLISTVCMIHRISLLQNLFESLTSNPKAQRILNNIQVEQIRMDLSKNMVKMDDLKSSLLNLLDSVEKVFNSNCANLNNDPYGNQAPLLMNTCTPPSSLPPPSTAVHDEG